MHMFLHVPDQGFLKPSEHWNLVLFSEYNKILEMFFFIPIPDIPVPKVNNASLLRFYTFSLPLAYSRPRPRPRPHLWMSPQMLHVSLLSSITAVWTMQFVFLENLESFAHLTWRALFEIRNVKMILAVVALFIYCCHSELCCGFFFFSPSSCSDIQIGNSPPKADISSRLTFYGESKSFPTLASSHWINHVTAYDVNLWI